MGKERVMLGQDFTKIFEEEGRISKIKRIDVLPKEILIMVAKEFGHRSPETESSAKLASFISDSCATKEHREGCFIVRAKE
jgi:hypothetical protein